MLKEIKLLRSLGLSVPDVADLAYELDRVRPDIMQCQIPMTTQEAFNALAPFLANTMKLNGVGFEARMRKKENGTTKKEEAVIDVEGLWYAYPGTSEPVLKNVSLRINHKDFIAIIGQNGSGKTTLVKHFNGLLRPTQGIVRIFGLDITRTAVWQLAQKVGYIFQNPDLQIFSSSVRDEIAFGLKALRIPIGSKVEEVSAKLSIQDTLALHPMELDRGRRQRVAIASVLVLNPEVLVVDEPTTGQDPRTASQIMGIARKLNEEGKTIVVITHNMGLAAKYANRVIVLQEGEILVDTSTREAFSTRSVLEKASLKPPQITVLAQELQSYGVPPDIMCVEEMVEFLARRAGQ